MFVATRAKITIQKKRQNAFYKEYIQPLAAEAQNLDISSEELIQMLQRALQQD